MATVTPSPSAPSQRRSGAPACSAQPREHRAVGGRVRSPSGGWAPAGTARLPPPQACRPRPCVSRPWGRFPHGGRVPREARCLLDSREQAKPGKVRGLQRPKEKSGVPSPGRAGTREPFKGPLLRLSPRGASAGRGVCGDDPCSTPGAEEQVSCGTVPGFFNDPVGENAELPAGRRNPIPRPTPPETGRAAEVLTERGCSRTPSCTRDRPAEGFPSAPVRGRVGAGRRRALAGSGH